MSFVDFFRINFPQMFHVETGLKFDKMELFKIKSSKFLYFWRLGVIFVDDSLE